MKIIVLYIFFTDQFEAMSDELERRREECLQLRALLAEKSISTHSIAKQSYGGEDDLVNEDNELTMAYKSQRDIIRYVLYIILCIKAICICVLEVGICVLEYYPLE